MSTSLRAPLMRTSDDFAWGSEARLSAGAQQRLWTRLMPSLSADVQWRGGSSEPDPFDESQRLRSANAGGWFVTASPSLLIAAPGGVSVNLTILDKRS